MGLAVFIFTIKYPDILFFPFPVTLVTELCLLLRNLLSGKNSLLHNLHIFPPVRLGYSRVILYQPFQKFLIRQGMGFPHTSVYPAVHMPHRIPVLLIPQIQNQNVLVPLYPVNTSCKDTQKNNNKQKTCHDI